MSDKELLTGRCKADFEQFLTLKYMDYGVFGAINWFNRHLPDTCKQGV